MFWDDDDDSNKDMPELINFLKRNEYELTSVEYDPKFGDNAIAKFSKMANLAEINGNAVNDAIINITIEFDTRFDYKNGVLGEEDVIYDDFSEKKAEEFINKLMNETYGDGKAKGKSKRKQSKRKTRKNKRK